jgi:dUTP pyrophosphatase
VQAARAYYKETDGLFIYFKKLHPEASMPRRTNPTDAGADLFAVETQEIKPLSRKLIKTGIAIQLPKSYYGRIAPRSGLALKHGIDVMAGVVDSSYRGEVCVLLYNTDSSESFYVKTGDRIAQIIIEQHFNFSFVECEELHNSDRSTKGFGSSGLSK